MMPKLGTTGRRSIVANANAIRVFRFLAGLPPLHEGAVVIGPGGEVVRLLADGGAEEVGPAVPTRRGVLVDFPVARSLATWSGD